MMQEIAFARASPLPRQLTWAKPFSLFKTHLRCRLLGISVATSPPPSSLLPLNLYMQLEHGKCPERVDFVFILFCFVLFCFSAFLIWCGRLYFLMPISAPKSCLLACLPDQRLPFHCLGMEPSQNYLSKRTFLCSRGLHHSDRTHTSL